MEFTITASGRISRPIDEVFEAVVNPDHLSRFFTTGGARGRLETGATVTWEFHDFPGSFPVEVVEVTPPYRIVLQWGASAESATGASNGEPSTTVEMAFSPVDGDPGRTLVQITESGWRLNDAGLAASYGNLEGWTGMLCAMKAWLEHGINLREGFYV